MNLIKASYLRACAPFQSVEETRPYLQGVQLEKHPAGGAIAVATNGKVMLICHDKTGQVDSPDLFPISKDLVKTSKRHRDDDGARYVRFDDGMATVLDKTDKKEKTLSITPCKALDATFVDWRRVLPAQDSEVKTTTKLFEVDRLRKFIDIHGSLEPGTLGPAFVMEHHGELVLVKFPYQPEVLGLVMTREIGSVAGNYHPGLPSWLLCHKHEKKAA